ncbi:MAG: sulfate transporter [Xanthomonadales bacterium]|nr:sulfate transporter [Xanthomonadales bacterium]|tara:strand:+ start:1935 stop:2228 length:294 start_codon:yes stop_codon:yes gene_type:complete
MGSDQPEAFRLEGRLTVDEVPAVYREHRDWKEKGPPGVVDLSGLQATDSSAVALLLEWLNWARARGKDIRFDNPPEALRTIAGLSQVDKLLGWKKDQ